MGLQQVKKGITSEKMLQVKKVTVVEKCAIPHVNITTMLIICSNKISWIGSHLAIYEQHANQVLVF